MKLSRLPASGLVLPSLVLALSVTLSACDDQPAPRAFQRPTPAPAAATAAATRGAAIPDHPVVGDIPDTLTLSVPATAPTEQCLLLDAGSALAPVVLKSTLVDEFDTLKIDDQHWTPHYDGGYDENAHLWLGYNRLSKRSLPTGEEQVYVDAGFRGTGGVPLGLNPFSIHDGVLGITADRTRPEHRAALGNAAFTSGLLTSRKFFNQTYGYFELRAQMPAGKALWPAFWLLPTDRSWPPEVDIFEVAGQHADIIKFNTHWNDSAGKYTKAPCQVRVEDAARAFHQYGALWTNEAVTFYVDRRPVATVKTPASMHKPMFVLMNLAVGSRGSVGKPDAETPTPSVMLIDHVAAWALEPARP